MGHGHGGRGGLVSGGELITLPTEFLMFVVRPNPSHPPPPRARRSAPPSPSPQHGTPLTGILVAGGAAGSAQHVFMESLSGRAPRVRATLVAGVLPAIGFMAYEWSDMSDTDGGEVEKR